MSYSSQVKGFGKNADARDNAASKSVAVDPTKPIAVPSIGGSNADIRENNDNRQADQSIEEQKLLDFMSQTPQGKEMADIYRQNQRDLNSQNKEVRQDAEGSIPMQLSSMRAIYNGTGGDVTKLDQAITDRTNQSVDSAWSRLGQPLLRNAAIMGGVVGTAGALSGAGAGSAGATLPGGALADTSAAAMTAGTAGSGFIGTGLGSTAAANTLAGSAGADLATIAANQTAATAGLDTAGITASTAGAGAAVVPAKAAGTNTLGDFVSNNAGSLLNTGLGLYNASQQGDAAKAIADQNATLNAPWHDAGVNALTTMQDGLKDGGQFSKKYTLADYQQDPYNKFLQDQGTQAIDRSAASKGMLGSGNVLAELSKYGQGMAGQGFNEQYNRFTQGQTNDWNRLSGLAGTGQTAAQQISNGNVYGIQGDANATSYGINSLADGFNNIQNNPKNSWNKPKGLVSPTSTY